MIIGLDIGGTKISAALLRGHEIMKIREAPSPIHTDLTRLLPTLESLISDWVNQAHGIGVGCTGLVGVEDVHFLSVGPDKRLPLKSLLEQLSGLPVLILNDAWAAAWGEYCLGEHTADNTLVYATVSTGIGGGIIHGGHLITSGHGFAAHIGHTSVNRPRGDNLVCGCGRLNCVEAIASGSAIADRASELLGRRVTCKEVFQQLASTPALGPLIDDCATAVAEMVANIKAITGTRVVVLGGSVGLNDHFRRRTRLALQALPDVYHVELRRPVLGRNADLIGAALALEETLDA